MGSVAIRDWMDSHLPGWNRVSPKAREALMRDAWKRGEFKNLRSAARSESKQAVKIGDTYYAGVMEERR